MNPNLKWKVIFILAVVVVCLYSIFGMPTFPTSFAQVKDNFAHQIKLGLDLQGGTHLILQVQVQEAVAQETDQTVDRLTTAMRQKNIHYEEVRRVDDEHIVVRGVPNDAVSRRSAICCTSSLIATGLRVPRRENRTRHCFPCAHPPRRRSRKPP